MRILLLSEWFQPEPFFRALPFAKALRDRGHEVEALTGFPNYPGGKVYEGYRIRAWQRETLDGIRVNRVPVYPSHDRSGIRRAVTFGSFAAAASVIGPALCRRPDVIYAYHPPATIALPAAALKALYGAPVVYDIQDLWPDTIAAAGLLARPAALKALHLLCDFAYRVGDRLVVLSPGYKRALTERGVPPAKIEVIFNWCDESGIRPSAKDPELERSLGLAGRFNVMFAGTMGAAQGLDAVLDAAKLVLGSAPRLQFVFVGGGIDKERLEARAHELGLTNALFLRRQPVSAMAPILAAADVLLIHLKDDPLFHSTIPSKTQAYMAAGKPVLIAVTGDAADLVREADAGLECAPENPQGIADGVTRFMSLSEEARREMGENGRRFYQARLSMKVGVDRFEQVFQQVVRRARARGRQE